MCSRESASVVCEPTSVWIGFQEGCGARPGFDLYNLLVAIPGHPEGSTVTANTLRKAGLEVPAKPSPVGVRFHGPNGQPLEYFS